MTRPELSSGELQHALEAWEGLEPSASLLGAVARVPLAHPRLEQERLSIWQQLRPFGLSLAAGAVGVCVGLLQASDLPAMDALSTQIGAELEPAAEWEQLAELAAGEEWSEAWDE